MKLALRILVVAMVVLMAMPLLADDRVQFLAERRRYPPPSGQVDDFCVRASAALALGTTNDDRAVAPLCAGLDDPSEIVRQAVAVALRRLARSASSGCLHKRATVEHSSSVKLQIQRAIELVESAGGGVAPADVAGAKYHVALSPVANQSDRAQGDVDRIVRAAISTKLSQLGVYQLAPGDESPAARAALAKRKLKGFFSLAIRVEPFDHSGGSLLLPSKRSSA